MLALLLATLFALGPDAEVARIQHHLAGAEAQLRAADVRGLSPDQRARRAALIDELARYRARGRFPRNLDFAARTPYFIDARGVRCAMAHLIETHGGGALVARVAATANNAYVAELAGDPELIAWLDANGLTVGEAARIQPSYVHEVGFSCASDNDCASGRCEPAPDYPSFSYCTAACDPAGDPCPKGIEAAPLTCQPVGDGFRCRYAGQTPGTPGWTCYPELAPFRCLGHCVAGDDPSRGVCAEDCTDDRTCADGFTCVEATDYGAMACVAPTSDGGCSAGGGGSPAALGLLGVAALLLTGAARLRAWARSGRSGRGRPGSPGGARSPTPRGP
ncbi:MAG TPA: hypothetical protein VM734_36270 [Kofleriaceae bacterium]|nr:hypothetical protein [Kofleriaceae bacterium]